MEPLSRLFTTTCGSNLAFWERQARRLSYQRGATHRPWEQPPLLNWRWIAHCRRYAGLLIGLAAGEAAGDADGEAAGVADGEAAGIGEGEAAGDADGDAAGVAAFGAVAGFVGA